MRCPSCGSDNCHIVEEVESRQKGFGFFKGCCGYLVLGPFGWLCGLLGMGSGTMTKKAFWVCTHCGRKFRV